MQEPSGISPTIGGGGGGGGVYNKLLMVLYVFEHKTQQSLIHAPYTRIVVVWHIYICSFISSFLTK